MRILTVTIHVDLSEELTSTHNSAVVIPTDGDRPATTADPLTPPPDQPSPDRPSPKSGSSVRRIFPEPSAIAEAVAGNGHDARARELLDAAGIHGVPQLLRQYAPDRIIDVCMYVRTRQDLANPAGYIHTILRRGWRLPRNARTKGERQ